MKYLPDLTEIADDLWRLDDKDLVVESLGYTLTVPKGFETDLASVPRYLWMLIAPFELGLAGPIVHDWIYEHGGSIAGTTHRFTREEADGLLRDITQQDGVAAWRRHLTYIGVRAGGASSWKP